MKRFHSMPFGAEVQEGEGVRFRLWAPQAQCVHLQLEPLEGEERLLPMDNMGLGWYPSAHRRRLSWGLLPLPCE